MIDYTLQTEIFMTDIGSWYYWNKLIQLILNEALLGVNSDKRHAWPWTGEMRATNWRRPTDYCNELATATPMSRLSDSEFENWQNCECPAEHLRVHYSVVTTE